MILQTSGAVAVPVVPAVQSAQILVLDITFDLIAHRFVMHYTVPGSSGPAQVDTGAIPGALQTALENHCQARVEADLGISGTTVTSP